MIYIWRAQRLGTRFRSEVILHIQIPSAGKFSAICGTHMKFNRSANAAYNAILPVCKNCLRACEDFRRAA